MKLIVPVRTTELYSTICRLYWGYLRPVDHTTTEHPTNASNAVDTAALSRHKTKSSASTLPAGKSSTTFTPWRYELSTSKDCQFVCERNSSAALSRSATKSTCPATAAIESNTWLKPMNYSRPVHARPLAASWNHMQHLSRPVWLNAVVYCSPSLHESRWEGGRGGRLVLSTREW